jgi:hypothetical protein
MSWLVHGVRFACEIADVLAVVWWGWPELGIVLGVLFVAVWGLWVAPRSAWRLRDPIRLLIELAIFAFGAVAFAAVGQSIVALVFSLASAVTAGLSRRFPAP